MEIKIGKTRNADLALEIVKGLGDFFDEDNYRELKRDVKNDTVYAAFDGKKMLGFIIFCELNPDVVELTWMAVRKESRGLGVGKKLISCAMEKIRNKKKYKMCYLKTIGEGDRQRSFENTRQFYLKFGFVALESVKPYPGWHKDKYVQTFVLCLKH